MIKKIISGGQTGVDRGALDAAIALGLAHGGFCPRGRRAEDGRIPDRYKLTETLSEGYLARTERNILESDATIIITPIIMTPGSRQTMNLCSLHKKQIARFAFRRDGLLTATTSGRKLKYLLETFDVINVAGSRESKAPGIQAATQGMLERAIRDTLNRGT